jgi:hypothetical protein
MGQNSTSCFESCRDSFLKLEALVTMRFPMHSGSRAQGEQENRYKLIIRHREVMDLVYTTLVILLPWYRKIMLFNKE